MKSSLMRSALALSLALGLSACGGGGKATFTIGGEVSGLVYNGLTLTSNGMTINVAPPTTPGGIVKFAFPNQIEYGDVYDVQIAKLPDFQSCQGATAYPTNSDTAGRLAVINVQLKCTVNSFAIGGQITGLTAEGLVLANGSTGGTLTVAKPTDTAAITYTMPVAVFYKQTYGVTVVKQPTGQFCTVSNATGEMPNAEVKNINVNCVAQP